MLLSDTATTIAVLLIVTGEYCGIVIILTIVMNDC